MPNTTPSYAPEHAIEVLPASPVYDRDAYRTVMKKLENHVHARRQAAEAVKAAS